MGGSIIAGAIAGGTALAGGMAWAVRGRSSTIFGPSVWHGDRRRPELALTFDDGPSPSTPDLLRVLDRYSVAATFFQCGMHVRRLPEVAQQVAAAGHELGNHTDTHPGLWMKSPGFVFEEVSRAQKSIQEITGVTPRVFRSPYGVRWLGLSKAQRELGLLHIMWTALGGDWKLDEASITSRVVGRAQNGAIFCLHDGREKEPRPDIRSTINAVERVIPVLLERGYRFRTISQLLR